MFMQSAHVVGLKDKRSNYRSTNVYSFVFGLDDENKNKTFVIK